MCALDRVREPAVVLGESAISPILNTIGTSKEVLLSCVDNERKDANHEVAKLDGTEIGKLANNAQLTTRVPTLERGPPPHPVS